MWSSEVVYVLLAPTGRKTDYLERVGMKLIAFTIILDGMPFVEHHLPEFENLSIPWEWRICEGTSANTNCTAWCKPQTPRLSRDGTSEYLTKISKHPNVKVVRRQMWNGGKVEMCNACLDGINEECVLLQVDSDEFHSANQMEGIVKMFQDRPKSMRAFFWCRYFLGQNIIATNSDGYSNRAVGEWLRAFRYQPGMMFQRHEAPILDGNRGLAITRDETKALGLVFNHFAWSLEKQVASKARLYPYPDSLGHWKRLQENKIWPIQNLKDFLPWVGDGATADLFSNVYPNEMNPMERFKAQQK